MKYYVTIAGEEHVVEIDGETVTCDGTSAQAHVELIAGTPIHKVTIGYEVHRVVARRGAEKGEYDLSLAGHRFQALALDERSRTIRELSGTATRQKGPAHLVAPMPGLIVRIAVKEGDHVQPGQGLVVMEAMKMENELRATAAGVVKRVVVAERTAVEKGAMLLEMGE